MRPICSHYLCYCYVENYEISLLNKPLPRDKTNRTHCSVTLHQTECRTAVHCHFTLLNVLLTGAQCAGGATAVTAARAQSAPAMRGFSPWRRVGNI